MTSLGRVLGIITGASRGFGRSLALELGRRAAPGSRLLLVSRSEEALLGVAGELGRECPEVRVCCEAADLSTEQGLEKARRAAEGLSGDSGLERIIIINNAGSLGNIKKFFLDHTDFQEVNQYFGFNVSSPLCLTSSILKAFPQHPGLQRVVVNVSSLAGLKPYKSWTLYCSGKAARDMMFKVLATEEPDIRVLNYAPGPLDTDMQTQVRNETADPKLRNVFIDMKNSGKLVDCQVSAKKMLDILQADTYNSGEHIDFFD
ncbi:sepiapterin reductase [Discoglossus pictus]